MRGPLRPEALGFDACDLLLRIWELHDLGVLSEDEFEQKKAELLARI